MLATAALLALSIVYCLPHHPSAGHHVVLDGVLHVATFAVVGLWLGRPVRRRTRTFVVIAILAALLEVAQWQLGGYAHVEWADIVANEIGVAIAWLATRATADRRGATEE
jgi:hypothetical protein